MRVATVHDLKKRCACDSTSSGPKLVFYTNDGKRRTGNDLGNTATAMRVEHALMACNLCGEPWTEDEP